MRLPISLRSLYIILLEFTSDFLPEELDRVYSIFRRQGAYSRYKELLSEKGLLEKWYKFEDERQNAALKEWCAENDIKIAG